MRLNYSSEERSDGNLIDFGWLGNVLERVVDQSDRIQAPTTASVDFELSLMNAIKNAFPGNKLGDVSFTFQRT
uniref:Uncharacterized protein n=1 Tax=Ditylenchus dipsaci TaxID=166011 RepID=A0A915EJ91_9BILA